MIMATRATIITVMITTTTRTTTMRIMAPRTAMITAITIVAIMAMITVTRTTTFMTRIVVTTMLMITPTKPGRSAPKRGGKAPVAETDAGAAGAIVAAGEHAALYRLMTWLSPAFPVGAFSYSSGLEWAVEAGDIVSPATLQDWLAAMLADGAGFCDGVFLAHAHRCVTAGDIAGLAEVAELAGAWVSSRERHLETTAQGRAFVEISRTAWSSAPLERMLPALGLAPAYPVAVGVVSAAHGVPLPATLHAFLHAVVANWISAAARLVPLGQTDSQRVLAALEPVVVATGTRALAASLDDLGSATFRADLAGMRHEAQYTRLFRS